MRMKYIFLLILFLACGVVAAVGGLRFQESRKQAELQKELAIIQNQFEMGRHDRVQANLAVILENNPRIAEVPSLWAMLARSYEATGDADQAQDAWAVIRMEYPDSAYMPDAVAAYARSLTRQGRARDALEQWDMLIAEYPGSAHAAEGLLGRAEVAYRNNDLPATKQLLQDVLAASSGDDLRRRAKDLLGDVNMAMLPFRADEIYVIARGDNLERIGRKFGISPELLARVNNIRDPRSLTVGRRLKVPHTDFSIVVDKTDNTLTLYDGGEFFKRYTVRTGREEYMTPVGEFHIESKVKDPTWNDPLTGRRFPPNDPGNQLGTRWMAFQGSLGIHGTIFPDTIGQYDSNGCVGMLTEDVEELFDLVALNTPVKIVGTMRRGSGLTE